MARELNDFEKISKINNTLISMKKRYELEIEELVEYKLRELVDIFNNDNKELCELRIINENEIFFNLISKKIGEEDFEGTFNFKAFMKEFSSPSIVVLNQEKNNNEIFLSKQFIDLKNDLKKIVEELQDYNIKENFFDIDKLDIDTNEVKIYKTLKNNINIDINDNSFLKLLSNTNKNIQWIYMNSSNTFYNQLSSMTQISNKDFIKESNNYCFLEKHPNILNQKLILESNLFNNIKNDLKIEDINSLNGIELKNNVVSIKIKNNEAKDYFYNLSKELNYDLRKLYKTLIATLELGKPNQIEDYDTKNLFLKMSDNFKYYGLFDEVKDNDVLFKKIETLDLNEIKEKFYQLMNFTFEVKNNITNEVFEKSFNGFEDMVGYTFNNDEIQELKIDR